MYDTLKGFSLRVIGHGTSCDRITDTSCGNNISCTHILNGDTVGSNHDVDLLDTILVRHANDI